MGEWISSPTHESSDFEFFIDQADASLGTSVLVKGHITDKFGYAEFTGSMDPGSITFTKLYSEEARRNPRSAQGEIVYTGRKAGNKYVGTYRVLQNERGAILDEGTFEMQKLVV